MSKVIHIGNVTVPLVDYAVGASAVLGIRDSGKTVTSKGICEQLIDHDVQPIIFDAVGKWRWMKVPGEGPRAKGYKIVVAGGRGPDLPLNPHSVTEIVRSALKERIPLVIDLFDKNLSKADWRRIVQTAMHIIHYENENGAVHVFLEEAAEFVPQKIYDGETYAEVEKLVRMGGNASVGITLINQRSQEVNKAVLDNCSTALVLGCQVGKNAIEAVEKWIERLDPKTADELTQSLPKLKSGEAWVWTRKSLDKPSREQMPMCRSFHPDRRTPETVLKTIKSIDTAEFVAKMAASIPKVIEEAKANDPAELKRQVAQLKRELSAKPKAVTSEPLPAIEVPVIRKSDLKAFDDAREALDTHASEFRKVVDSFNAVHAHLLSHRPTQPRAINKVIQTAMRTSPRLAGSQRHNPKSFSAHTNGESEPGKGAREVLKAAAQHNEGVTDEQIAVLTGYKKTSRTTFKQQLLSRGLLDKGGRGFVATQNGIDWLGNDFSPLPTGADLRNHWLGKLSGGELELFKIYIANFPNEVRIEELMGATGYQKTSVTTFRQKLSARNLIVGKAASPNLFD